MKLKNGHILITWSTKIFDKHGIQYSSEVILLIPNTLGKKFISSSNKEPIIACFVC